MDGAVVIRQARDEDGPALVAVWDHNRCYYAELDPTFFQAPDPTHPVDGEEFAASLRRDGQATDRFGRVAEMHGRVVGYIVARLDPPAERPREQLVRELAAVRGYVEALGVARSAWRRGVGRRLMHAAEAWAREKGAVVMKLDTNARSPVSIPFYEALGYERQAIIFRKPL